MVRSLAGNRAYLPRRLFELCREIQLCLEIRHGKPPHPAFWLVAGEDAVRPRARKTGNNHAGALACTPFPLKRCIMGASKLFAGNVVCGLPFAGNRPAIFS
jgi:hypothetical protein